MDIKTVRAFEQRLLPIRSIAGADEAWEAYAKDMLPDPSTAGKVRDLSLIEQGFTAGYADAMRAVGGVLTAMQTEALKQTLQPWDQGYVQAVSDHGVEAWKAEVAAEGEVVD